MKHSALPGRTTDLNLRTQPYTLPRQLLPNFQSKHQGEGYHHHFQGHCAPSGTGEGVSTVFSAPMYTTHSNRGGVLLVRGDGGVDPLGYDAAPEPAVLNRCVCVCACVRARL